MERCVPVAVDREMDHPSAFSWLRGPHQPSLALAVLDLRQLKKYPVKSAFGSRPEQAIEADRSGRRLSSPRYVRAPNSRTSTSVTPIAGSRGVSGSPYGA